MCKLQNFYVIQILREIKIGELEFQKLSIVKTFSEDLRVAIFIFCTFRRVLGKYTDPTDHRPYTQTNYFLIIFQDQENTQTF